MHITVTNNSTVDLNLLKFSTFLDRRRTKKVNVYYSHNSSAAPFRGISVRSNGNYSEDSWALLPVGSHTFADFDAAEIYDLSDGGKFKAVVSGAFQYTERNSTVLHDRLVPYQSNVIEIDVDGGEAAEAMKPFLTPLDPDSGVQVAFDHRCNDLQRRHLTSASRYCTLMARSGAREASLGTWR